MFLIARLLSKINVNIKKKLFACATMHSTTLETQVLLIYIYFFSLYISPVKIERTIMLENTEHNVNHNYIIYH